MDQDEDLDTPALRRLLRTLSTRPSKSAGAARERQLAEIRAMSAEERILLALRLGRRDRALGECRPDAWLRDLAKSADE